MHYRAEIDGLRAIAVVSVILYHAEIVLSGVDYFEGGYIGVDIFFCYKRLSYNKDHTFRAF